MARSVKVKDIARYAEVSVATVSRVLNNHENINEDIRQRVLQVATELGYFKTSSRHFTARNTEHPIKEIGFLFCYEDIQQNAVNSDPFWTRVLYGAETEARKENILLLYQAIARNEASYLLQMKLHEMRIQGILLVGPSEPETIHSIHSANIPFVLVDNYCSLPEYKIDAVLADNYNGAKQITCYLLEQGHRNIAYVGGYSLDNPPNHIYTFNWRKEGYLAALSEAGIAVNDRLLYHCNIVSLEDSIATCRKLIDSHEPFSAIFCANDATASWIIKGLRECGLRVPEDISVAGFDDTTLAEHLTPSLTTIRVHKEDMGATGVRALVARIAEPHRIQITYTLGVDLIKRDSVQPLTS